jgi:predicted HNH restriction endonuclease
MVRGGKITAKKKKTKRKTKTKGKDSKFLGSFSSYGMQPLSKNLDTGDTFQDKERTTNGDHTISSTGKVKSKSSKSRGTFYSTARTNVFKGGA